MCFSSPSARTRSRLTIEATRNSSTYNPAPPTRVRSVMRATPSRFVTRAKRWSTMSAAPVKTALAKNNTVSGLKPSVIIGLLLDFGRACGSERTGLFPHKRARASATPIPRAPVDVFLVPALEQAVHHDAPILLVQLRQGGK